MNFGSLNGFEITCKMEKEFSISKTGPGPIFSRVAQLVTENGPLDLAPQRARPGATVPRRPGSHGPER
jgi:hypothetical protein